MRKLLFFLSSVLTITAHAQSTNQGKIRIAIVNEKATALENATVVLIKAKACYNPG